MKDFIEVLVLEEDRYIILNIIHIVSMEAKDFHKNMGQGRLKRIPYTLISMVDRGDVLAHSPIPTLRDKIKRAQELDMASLLNPKSEGLGLKRYSKYQCGVPNPFGEYA